MEKVEVLDVCETEQRIAPPIKSQLKPRQLVRSGIKGVGPMVWRLLPTQTD